MRLSRRKFLKASSGLLLPAYLAKGQILSGDLPFLSSPSAAGGFRNGLVSYWLMGENITHGTRVDSMGIQDLTDVHNNTPSNASALLGGRNAGVFVAVNGGNDSALRASSTPYVLGSGNSFSINSWIAGSGNVGGWLFSKWAGATNEWVVFVPGGSPNNQFQATEVGTLANRFIQFSSTGGLQMITLGYDSPNQVLFVQISKAGVVGTRATAACAGIIAGTSRLCVGNGDGAAQYSSSGDYQDTGYWNRALTTAEVTTLYNGGAGKAFSTF